MGINNTMKRVMQPFMDSVHYQYEKLFFYAAPRSRSSKQRKYTQIDLTKEFEIRTKRREAHK